MPGPPASWIAAAVARGECSAQAVALARLRRIAELDPTLRALVAVDAKRALAQARAIDTRRGDARPLGPLAGVPFVVKDNIDVAGQVTTCGSLAHAGIAAVRDAPVVARLLAADAVLLGRANMDELAMGASTGTSAYGATRNPWDELRSPGGSSGGSAAAVAAGLATFALGTDTGGSIREPAAQCGVVGLAPSPGVLPLDGVAPFAAQFDRVGPITATVSDAELVMQVLCARACEVSSRLPRRVGVITEFAGRRNQPAVLARLAAARSAITSLGVEVVDVSVPDAAQALTAYLVLTSAACVEHVAAFVQTGRAGAEVVRRWELGRALLGRDASRLYEARAVRQRLVEQCRAALGYCDVLLSPTMPTTAPLLAATRGADFADPLVAPYTDCWTVVANLAGLAALSVPFGVSSDDAMPVAMMLTGAAGADDVLLALGRRIEIVSDGRANAGR